MTLSINFIDDTSSRIPPSVAYYANDKEKCRKPYNEDSSDDFPLSR